MGGIIDTSKAEAEDVWFNVWSHVCCIPKDDEARHTRFTAFPVSIQRSSSDPIPAASRPLRAIKDIQPRKHSISSIQPTQSSVSSPSARPAALTVVGKPAQNEAKMRRSPRNLRTMSEEAWKCHGTPPGTALARLVDKKFGGLQENTKRYTSPKTPSVCVFVCVSHPSIRPLKILTLSLSLSFAFSRSL